jgi:hypothetical protein
MILTDHDILTEEGWKAYKDIKRKKINDKGKLEGENDKLVSFNIKDNTIVTEEFVGELYSKKSMKLIYNIKNNYIDTTVIEDHSFPYKLNETDDIKIDKLPKILYLMEQNKYESVYLFTNSQTVSPILVKKDDMIKDTLEVETFSFMTKQQTFYVRKNGLEFWTSY